MDRLVRVLVFTAFVFYGAVQGHEGYDLESVSNMGRVSLPDEARALLSRNGFVVAGPQFKQVFQAYIGNRLPAFITTDSAWHTYHVLLEEGVRQMEETQARRLLDFSRLLRDTLLEGMTANEAYSDLALFASVGLALQDGESVEELPDGLKSEASQTLRALQGSDQVNVLFFGLPFMPQRLTPISFYARSPLLSGYFAARQWYALCDFRALSEEETAQAFRLARVIQKSEELYRLYRELSDAYGALLAEVDDGDVESYLSLAKKVLGGVPEEEDLREEIHLLQDAIKQHLPDPRVNDQMLLPKQYLDFPRFTKGFRLFTARQIPSAVLFQNTVAPKIPGRMFPTGVDFFATGRLASAAAKRAIELREEDAKYAELIFSTTPPAFPDSLHGKTLDLLTLLQDPVPEQAPDPMKTQAWHDKQLSTQLSAWAEQRHLWALHTKLTITSLCATINHPGVVSPYPEFFEGLGRLARDTAAVLDRFTVESPEDVIAMAKWLVEALEYAGETKHVKLLMDMESARRRKGEFWWTCKQHVQSALNEDLFQTGAPYSIRYTRLSELAQSWAGGAQPTAQQIEVLRRFKVGTGYIPPYLEDFAGLCDTLARIARLQLDGEAPSEEQTNFLMSYGETLGRFHFYGGNSYLDPRDDFPITTPIYDELFTYQFLYAGLGRPESLYVIVDVDGVPVLHRGAVLTYREFLEDAGSMLTDESWRQRIGEDLVPPPPAFTASYRMGGEFNLK